jgi:hypothetical protein
MPARARLIAIALSGVVLAATTDESTQTSTPAIAADVLPVSERFADERQFLAADKKGRLVLLRGGNLMTHRLRSNGQLDEPDRLKAYGGEDRSLDVVTAAFSPAGDAWFVGNATAVQYFLGGKEVLLPSPDFIVTGVGLPGGTPTVAIEPKNLSGRATVWLPGEAPYLLQLAGDDWQVLASEALDVAKPTELLGLSFHARVARRIAAAPQNRIWVAHQARYRVELLSPTGKRLLQLKVGTGEARMRRATEAEHQDLVAAIGADLAGSKPAERIVWVNRALADGGDGRLYLLVSDGGKLALDRLDPLELKLERIHVANVEDQGLTLAAASDGLYLASIDGAGGFWRIRWEVLDQAKWQAVPEASFDGGVLVTSPKGVER